MWQQVRLDQKTLDEIFDIYKEVTGCVDKGPILADVKKSLQVNNVYEQRTSSQWFPLKFIIERDRIYFYPNWTPATKRETKAVEKAQKLFGERIKSYLERIF